MQLDNHTHNPDVHQQTMTRRRALAMASVALFAMPRLTLAADPTASELLKKASSRLAEVDTMHFTLDIEGDTWIEESHSIQLRSAEGDLARPDKVSVEFKVTLLGAGTVTIKMITIGDASWTTDLITGKWGGAPPEFGYNPSVLYDNQNGLGPVAGKLTETTVEGTDSVDDHACDHIVGYASQDEINPLTAGTMSGDRVKVELWLDQESADMRRVKLTEPDNDDNDHPATWTLNLSRFNEKVTIEDPT